MADVAIISPVLGFLTANHLALLITPLQTSLAHLQLEESQLAHSVRMYYLRHTLLSSLEGDLGTRLLGRLELSTVCIQKGVVLKQQIALMTAATYQKLQVYHLSYIAPRRLDYCTQEAVFSQRVLATIRRQLAVCAPPTSFNHL